MLKIITVNVTQEDIDTAVDIRRSNPCRSLITYCPIAQALKKLFPDEEIRCGYKYANVGREVYFPVEEERMASFTRTSTDSWYRLQPISFQMERKGWPKHELHN